MIYIIIRSRKSPFPYFVSTRRRCGRYCSTPSESLFHDAGKAFPHSRTGSSAWRYGVSRITVQANMLYIKALPKTQNTRVYGGEKFFLTFRGILAGLVMNKYTCATPALHIYT